MWLGWHRTGEGGYQGAQEELRGDHGGRRIARQAEGQDAVLCREPGRLAGLHGDLLEDGREALGCEGAADDIVVADGCAADGDDDIARNGETLAHVSFVVMADAEVDRLGAPATDKSKQCGLDRVDDLTG